MNGLVCLTCGSVCETFWSFGCDVCAPKTSDNGRAELSADEIARFETRQALLKARYR